MQGSEKEARSETDKAYDGILQLVLRRLLRPGERTSAIVLAKRLNLGRTSVKEAITVCKLKACSRYSDGAEPW